MPIAVRPGARIPQLKLALWLGAAAAVAAIALLPYVLVTMPERFAALPMPLWAVALMQVVQTGVICGLLAWAGLHLGARHGLGAPWLHAWIYQTPAPTVRPHWLFAVMLGIATAALISAIDSTVLPSSSLGLTGAWGMAWRGAMASFYGGIAEEIDCRLFLVSLIVWLLAYPRRGSAQPWMFIVAIAFAALLFGMGHLPAMFAMGMSHTVLAMGCIVLLNALVGAVCGGLYWKLGLEHAMLAHFSADIVLHVFMPLLQGAR